MTKHYKSVVAVIVLLTIVMGYFAVDIEFTTGNALYMPNNEQGDAYFELQENFGEMETMFIVVRDIGDRPNVLTREMLLEIFSIEWEIMNRTETSTLLTPEDPSQSVLSIADVIAHAIATYNDNPAPNMTEKFESLKSLDDTMIRSAISLILNSDEISEADKSDLKSLISRDFVADGEPDAALIVFLFRSPADRAEQERVRQEEVEVNTYMQDYDASRDDIEILLTAGALIDHENNRASMESMSRLLPIAFVVLTVVLAITYRNAGDTLISLIAILFAIIWTLGANVLLGFYFTPFHVGVPILIIGLGIDYGIHLLMHYRQEVAEGRSISRGMTITITTIGIALFLCTVTTVIGFSSNVSSPLRVIREFGLLCALGIIFSFIIMTTFTIAARVLFDHLRIRREKPLLSEKRKQWLRNMGSHKPRSRSPIGVIGARRAPILVIGLVILFTLLSARSTMFLRTHFDPADLLYPESEQFKTFEYMGERFDLSHESTNIMIWADMTNPEVVRRINTTQNNLRNDKYVIVLSDIPQADSVLTLMQTYARDNTLYYNESFALQYRRYVDRDEDGYIDENVTAANLQAIYTIFYHYYPMDAKFHLHRTQNADGSVHYDGAVIRVKTDSRRFKYINELHAELDEDCEPLDGVAESYTITGGPIVTKVIINAILTSQYQSLFIMMLAAMIVLMSIFYYFQRSLTLGVLTTLPVLLVIIWTWGTMVIFEIPLNMLTAMMASLTIGIGIDYSIHVTQRFVQMLDHWGNIDIALNYAVKETGRVLAGAALTTIGGFGILVFSFMPVIRQFGFILALTIFYAMIAAVFVLPTFLLQWARWKVRHGKLELQPLTKERYEALYGPIERRPNERTTKTPVATVTTTSTAVSGASSAKTKSDDER